MPDKFQEFGNSDRHIDKGGILLFYFAELHRIVAASYVGPTDEGALGAILLPTMMLTLPLPH